MSEEIIRENETDFVTHKSLFNVKELAKKKLQDNWCESDTIQNFIIIKILINL